MHDLGLSPKRHKPPLLLSFFSKTICSAAAAASARCGRISTDLEASFGLVEVLVIHHALAVSSGDGMAGCVVVRDGYGAVERQCANRHAISSRFRMLLVLAVA